MIKSVSLDSDETLHILGKETAIDHLSNYLYLLFDKSPEFWKNAYQEIRHHVRTNEWQTRQCYSIHYRLEILFREYCLPVDKLDECARCYYRAETDNTQFFPEVLDIIRQLRKKYKVGITTDSPLVSKEQLSPCLQKVGITTADLDFLIISEHTKRTGIPFDILIKEMEGLGIMPYEIVHIGDNVESDIIPAQDRGINAMLFDPRKDSFNELIESIENLK